VYIHYRTKEDLLLAVSRLGHTEALNCLSQAASGAREPTERLRGMVAAFSTWHMDNAKLGRIAQYEFAALSPTHRREIVELRRRIQRLVRTVIQSGVASGEFDVTDIAGAADAVLSLSIDLVRWFDPARRRRAAIAAQHAELAVRMLRGCPPPPSTERTSP
jgi:AcrR family transcriptional regulator